MRSKRCTAWICVALLLTPACEKKTQPPGPLDGGRGPVAAPAAAKPFDKNQWGAHACVYKPCHERFQSFGQISGRIEVPLDHIRRMIGMGGDKLLPAVAHVSDDSEEGRAITDRKKEIFGKLLPGLEATTGARSLLQYLKDRDVELIIATSADDKEMTALLKQAGVTKIAFGVTPVPAETSGGGKAPPAPAPIPIQK